MVTRRRLSRRTSAATIEREPRLHEHERKRTTPMGRGLTQRACCQYRPGFAALSMLLVSKSELGQAAPASRRRFQRRRPLERLLWRIARTDLLPTWHHSPRAPTPSHCQVAYLAGDDLFKMAHLDDPAKSSPQNIRPRGIPATHRLPLSHAAFVVV
jgi:hypothetical protein